MSFKDAMANVWAGVRAAAVGIASLVASTWAGMSPEARSFVVGLGIGFGLGAFAVGAFLC